LRKEGLGLIDQGRIEEGMYKLEEAVRTAPDDLQHKSTLVTTRQRVTIDLNNAADRALAADNAVEAETLYRRVLALDPKSERALAGLRSLDSRKSADSLLAQAQAMLNKGDADNAGRILDSAQALNPRHPGIAKLRAQIDQARVQEATNYPSIKSKLSKPVSLEFRDANLKMVFDVLSRSSGINFVFDKDVRGDLTTTIFVKKVAVEDAVDLLLLQSQLEKRVINDNTLLIYPNTPQKTKDYQDLVIKSFYLANAEAKQTLNMLKTILKTRDIFVDEKLNLLVMRDTPDAIRIAEKLIASQDLAEPEVLLEVEVLEVTQNAALNLGIEWPGKIGFTVTKPDSQTAGTTTVYDPTTGQFNTTTIPGTTSTTASTITKADLRQALQAGGNRWLALSTPLSVTLNAAKTNGDINTLATPRIRAKNHEKAKVLIGSRVPVITNSVTPVSTGTPVVTGSVNYLDVGLKLEVEPTVQLDGDVVIKMNLEVSNITNTVTESSGTRAYEIGTRNASTTLRLKDGETQILAGLIQNDQRSDATKIPLLGEIPLLGRLFGSQNDSSRKTEIALSITPHVVHNVRPFIPAVTELISGSETSMKAHLPGQRPVKESSTVPLRGAPSAAAIGASSASSANNASAAAPASAGPLTLTLTGAGDAKVGQAFSVTLQARADEPVISSAMQFAYDTSALRVLEVTEGDLLRQDGAQTNFSKRVDAAGGKVFIGLTRSGGSGARGTGSLVSIKFEATAAKVAAPIQVAVFSGVGAANNLLPSTLPEPLLVKISP
jgi:general secretion pathway protein D